MGELASCWASWVIKLLGDIGANYYYLEKLGELWGKFEELLNELLHEFGDLLGE